MDASRNSNPSPSTKSNIYHISGVPVEFPYGSQLAFMSRVISTLDRARRQGHCNALLESPTGTGKTLLILCSSLTWQQHQSIHILPNPTSTDSPPPEAADPLIHDGGFIPDPDPFGNPEKPQQSTKAKSQKKLTTPNIYYASRTHSQISQVIREYRKTSYRVPMAILASRKHYCTNKHVCGKENVDEVCKLLLKDSSGGCLEFKNANKVRSHPSLQTGGCFEVHDIEDLVRIGQRVKGCSYFAAQTLAAEAQLVFCPYSYIINPIVRRAMDVDIKGSILILDEAHNVEDMAREGGSVDVEEEVLHALQAELGQLCMNDNLAATYRPLYDVIEGIVGWINIRKNNLQRCEFEHYLSSWTGEKAKQELQQTGISQQCFPVLQECATKAIKAASDAAPGGTHLTGISLITLEGLFSSLSYFFSGNGCHANDYQLALRRYVKRDGGNGGPFDWTISLSLWCLNPAVVFREIAELSLSVILTSGTLSPVSSFSSELGVRFDTCMEAPHVINTESQLWAAVVSSGVGNVQLNASYRSADSFAFQDSLGSTLEEICRIVPGGALVFFPSYKLLEKLHARWHQTGQWSRLNAQKDFFVEPRGSSNEFEPVLRGYYDAISGKSKAVAGKIRLGLKRTFKHSAVEDSHQNLSKGAAFLAVCRGKVSEGIDFSDDNARVVVIVGIPFPNKNDFQVMLKKKFNDTYKSSKNLLSGSEWYCHQAFRALNQAAGRCIRHRFDYGAIILLDERYKEQRNLAYISKWLRSSIKSYKNFDDSLEGLQTFFRDIKQLQIIEEGSNDLTDIKINQFTAASTCLVSDSSPAFQPQTPVVKRKAGETDENNLDCCINHDFENKSLKHFRSQSFSHGSSPDLPMVVDEDAMSTGRDTSRLDYFPNLPQFSDFPTSLSCAKTSNGSASPDAEKLASPPPSDAKQDQHFVTSASSCNQNKRRLKAFQNSSYPETHCSNLCFEESAARFAPIDQRTEFSMEDNEKKLKQELYVCCSSCKNPLGLPENRFLVKGLMIPSSKVFLAYIRIHGTQASFMPECLSKTPPADINVLISETMFISELIVRENAKANFSKHGVWCEEDGCVFKIVFCPFCQGYDTCLGVHVLATDASNVDLLNKVLIFADCLCVSEPKASNERNLPKSGNFLGKCSDHVENQKYSCKVPLEEPAYDDTEKKPAAIMKNIYNEKNYCKVASKMPVFSPNQMLVAHKNGGNIQSKPVEIEKFAYKPETRPATQKLPDQTEKSARCSQSKLKLPRRQ